MSIQITIASVDRTNLIDWRSLSREQVLSKEPDKLNFSLHRHSGQTYKPTVGDEVVLTISSVKQFGGYIIEINESIDGLLQSIDIKCKDYTHELDRQLVSKTYTEQTVNQIITDLLSTFSTGFTSTNTNCTTVIDKVVFNYLPISKCLEKLTELVGNFEWYVDYNRDIYFFATSDKTSLFNLTDTSNNYAFGSLSLTENTSQLRNEIIVRGGLVTSTVAQTENMSGDGIKFIFPLATKFSALPAVSIGPTQRTVGVENISPSGFDCYWNYNEKSLKFIVAPISGVSNITASTTFEFPLILQQRNEASITTYGLFQQVIVDKTIKDLDVASLRANAELIRYGVPTKSANFITYTDGLLAGDTINIQSTLRGINQNFKIQMIRSRLKTPVSGLVHTVEAITADDVGINDILTKLLIKNPSDQIEIESDESVSRIRQLQDSFGITDSTPTASKTSPPYLVGTTAVVGFFTMG